MPIKIFKAESEAARSRLIHRMAELRQKTNSRTGKRYTLNEIGKRLGMTGSNVHYYLSHESSVCRTCGQSIKIRRVK